MKNNPKPDIESFLKVIRNQTCNYIPIVELGVHPLIKERFIGKKLNGLEDEVEFWFNAGYDYVKLQPKADFNPAKIGLSNNLSYNDDGTVFRKWASEGSGVITDSESFNNYLFPSKEDFSYDNFERVKSFLPEGMGVIGQYGDIFTMTWEMMGFESFSYALFENESLIEELNNKLGSLVLSMFEYFAQSENVDALWYSDDIAYTNSLIVSPQVLDKYFFCWLKKIGDLAKKYKKPLIYHSDGVLFSVMNKIIDCGVTALHPIEPKAMNIFEVKEKFGKDLCLIGNIDVDLLSRGTEEDVTKQVLAIIEKLGRNGGFCIGSGNSVPEYVKFENYLAMINTVKSVNSDYL